MRVYFIGIGGIGVSAMAIYFLKNGWEVLGSDLVSSEITDNLKKMGAKIFIGKQKGGNLPQSLKMVVYSPAVKENNLELKRAYQLKKKNPQLRILSYPQLLGELTKKYFTIAVTGTHGKSTTASMIALILIKGGLDPTLIVGTRLKELKNLNCRIGKSKYLVIEADEHFSSFLNYWPKIIVLTNIEADHLDYYKNFENYLLAFKKFVSHLPKNGFLIANKDDKVIFKNFSKKIKNLKWYSLKDKERKKLKNLLKIPGIFNISNALAALKCARTLKISDEVSFKTLSEYKGSWRRFDVKKGKKKKITLISDYAHHPTEIKVTLEAAREKYIKNKIWFIFQPHQYQRTFYLFKSFLKVFKEILEKKIVDKLIITDIYEVKGREEKRIKKKVSAKKLIKEIKHPFAIYLSRKKILNYLLKYVQRKDIVIFMGAGDIYKLVDRL